MICYSWHHVYGIIVIRAAILGDQNHSICSTGTSATFLFLFAVGSMSSQLLTLWMWCVVCAILVWLSQPLWWHSGDLSEPLCQLFEASSCRLHGDGHWVTTLAMTVETYVMTASLVPSCGNLCQTPFAAVAVWYAWCQWSGESVMLPWHVPQIMMVVNYGMPCYILVVVLRLAWLQSGGPLP